MFDSATAIREIQQDFQAERKRERFYGVVHEAGGI